MIRVFVDPAVLAAAPRNATIEGDEHHYLARVRRATVGDAIELVDRAGHRATGHIVAIGEAHTVVAIGAVQSAATPSPRVTAMVPPIKGDRMDYCLEKLVEVGVDDIVVWPAARAVVRLDDQRRATRVARQAAQLAAAARQCGRATVPGLRYVDSLASALAAVPTAAERWVLDPRGERRPSRVAADTLAIVSGPEGGFTGVELAALHAAAFTAVDLSPHVLRAETAPLLAVALVRWLDLT